MARGRHPRPLGNLLYLRDLASGEFWSTAYQPTMHATRDYQAVFAQARAEFRQTHGGLEARTEISVSPRTTWRCGG